MNRLALPALVAMLLATPAHAAPDWSSWWRNADQRGERLMRNGDSAGAAKVFADPRRRAYAESQAGNSEAAVKDLSGFDDSDSHYNRGNALARSGKLEEALKAYDSALEHDPHNEDARRNRDLVAQALDQQKQQQDQQQSQDGKSGDQKNDGKGNENKDQGGDKSGGSDNSKSSSNSDSKNDGGAQQNRGKTQDQQQSQSRADSAPQKQPDQASSGKSGDQHQESPGKDGAQQQAGQPDADKQKQQSTGSAAQAQAGQKNEKDEKEQAQQDAAAGLKDAQQNAQGSPAKAMSATQEGGKPGGDPMSAGPVSEQKLAEDQWLRRIPDDPGGLLRRKFMIEHMLKQKQSQQDSSQ